MINGLSSLVFRNFEARLGLGSSRFFSFLAFNSLIVAYAVHIDSPTIDTHDS